MSQTPSDQRNGLMWLQILAAACLAVALAGLGWLVLGGKGQLALKPGDLGQGSYQLQTTTGQGFTAATLQDGPSLVFFGFTHCPDVCPTTLGDIAQWRAALGPDGEALRVFFITVDPARDTVAVLQDYLSWLPGAVGVTGSQAEVDKALQAFRVFARKGPLVNGTYSMDHTASVLLFDASGQLQSTLSYQAPEAEALGKLQALLTR